MPCRTHPRRPHRPIADGESQRVDLHEQFGVIRGIAGTGNRVYVLYDRVAPEAPYFGVRRAFLRPLLLDPEARRDRAARR